MRYDLSKTFTYKIRRYEKSGGSTTWERCRLGLPSIVSILSEDQQEGTETMARKDHIINLDWANNLAIKDYVEIIKNINKLKTNYKRGLKLVDGKGCIRVANEIKSF